MKLKKILTNFRNRKKNTKNRSNKKLKGCNLAQKICKINMKHNFPNKVRVIKRLLMKFKVNLTVLYQNFEANHHK